MRLLLLGGTADARCIADTLHSKGLDIIYGIAGLVRSPTVLYPVISGGFRQLGGFKHYLKATKIDLILDATHPYAAMISHKAVLAAKQTGIPCWRYHRSAWQQDEKKTWNSFSDWDDLAQRLRGYIKPFFTIGQLAQHLIQRLEENKKQQIVVRTAVASKYPLPENTKWIQGIGPFILNDEIRLMTDHKIDALVSKNSGGKATAAKIKAAKQLSIPVFILDRPVLTPVEKEFHSIEHCINTTLKYFQQNDTVPCVSGRP